MEIIKETGNQEFPLKWANLNNYIESVAFRKEIYLKEEEDLTFGLIELFYNLFGNYKSSLLIYNDSWWDFTLDTWNYEQDIYDYSFENKSKETIDYLSMLKESGIKNDYSGICKCYDWNKFLEIVLPCIISMKAIYSPIIFSKEEDFFFYFHHTGSIGLYYKKENESIMKIIDTAYQKYIVE